MSHRSGAAEHPHELTMSRHLDTVDRGTTSIGSRRAYCGLIEHDTSLGIQAHGQERRQRLPPGIPQWFLSTGRGHRMQIHNGE